jgi:anti-sigma regulatory factor (Ser/Thr protein kinase)
VRLGDEGGGFDPAAIPDPATPDNMFKPRGRGILLVRRVTDEVHVGHTNQGGTAIRLIKRIEASAGDN